MSYDANTTINEVDLSDVGDSLTEILHYLLWRRATRKILEKQLAEKICMLYDEVGYFLWSFPLLGECEEQLSDIIGSLSDTRILISSASVLLPKTVSKHLYCFLNRCEYDIALWKRRSNGTASMGDWGVEPEKDHYYGVLADYYEKALNSLGGHITNP